MKIDWKDKKQVIQFAQKLGKGMTVFFNGKNFQITHTSRKDQWEGKEVVFQT